MATLTFAISYDTRWGESLAVDIEGLGERPLTWHPGGRWSGSVDFPAMPPEVTYSYVVRTDGAAARREWGGPRKALLPAGISTAALVDRWHVRPAGEPFYSRAFTRCFMRYDAPAAPPVCLGRTVALTVAIPGLQPGQQAWLCGSSQALGAWQPAAAVALHPGSDQCTRIAEIARPDAPVEFKVIFTAPGIPPVWEAGDNRRLDPAALPDVEYARVECAPALTPLPRWRGAGTAIPVFSLRTDADWGIGDFADMADMARWVSEAGQSVLQILPVNDTTTTGSWADSYPYNAISTFALHPVYLRPDLAGELADEDAMERFRAQALRLNELPDVDYEAAFALKDAYMRRLHSEQGEATRATPAYREFARANAHWLPAYCAFSALRHAHSSANPADWGEFAVYTPSTAGQVADLYPADTAYYAFLQYHLHLQLRAARSECHRLGVALKGDIPIGISRCGVDAWTHPGLFNLRASAGAPPDDFAVLGQNWGFPTYRWDVMAADGYAWWRSRFAHMAQYFDAYRIDHVLGFFRIWQIPLDAIHGLLGTFNPALALSPDEMLRAYGFRFDPLAHTRPYITDAVIDELFGPTGADVRRQFLTPAGADGRYALRPQFASQQRVADHFASLPGSGDNNRMLNGLLQLIDDVLFIADPERPELFHPRIIARRTYAWQSLLPEQQQAFGRLYEDFFYHRSDAYWRDKAMQKLPALIDSNRMLCCAEDLGMIPPCVPSVMDALEILSLKVQRMPSEPGVEFGAPATYPYYSVCTTSTHDMGGFRQWWEENPQRTQRFYTTALHQRGQAPYYAEPWICELVVRQHLASPAMLCILPLQDWLAIDGTLRRTDPRQEQINDPANPANRWNYRMHLTIGELRGQFADRLRSLTRQAGR